MYVEGRNACVITTLFVSDKIIIAVVVIYVAIKYILNKTMKLVT